MNLFKKTLLALEYSDRYYIKKKIYKENVGEKAKFLKLNGFVILEDFFSGEDLLFLQRSYKNEIENKYNFELPCLSQVKIDEVKHKQLIDNFFKYFPEELEKFGVTFNRSDFENYRDLLEKLKPSTLKTYLTNIPDFFLFWLNEDLLDIIEEYLGLRPHLVEAYIRRNFPAKYKVMNHFWHRDTNHPDYLIKAFIFFSNCTITTGPHEYISGTIKDQRITGNRYYSDDEIDKVYPYESPQRIRSIVKAGTVILEDTRGLHRATIPQEGYRDLGFAVFLPQSIFSRNVKPLYGIPKSIYNNLSNRQKSYIPKKCIV